MPVEGGTQLFIKGVREETALIEVELRHHNEVVWRSAATSQYVIIEMSNRKATQ